MMIFVLPFLSLLIASPVDFLSRIYLQVTSLYTQLLPKPRPPFTWGAATVSLWSPEATLAPLSAVPLGLSRQNALAQTKVRSSYSLKCSDGSPAHSRWDRNSIIWPVRLCPVSSSNSASWVPPLASHSWMFISRFRVFQVISHLCPSFFSWNLDFFIRISSFPLHHLLPKLYPLGLICI